MILKKKTNQEGWREEGSEKRRGIHNNVERKDIMGEKRKRTREKKVRMREEKKENKRERKAKKSVSECMANTYK